MTNKELIQQQIDELNRNLMIGRATGKTYRAINRCIEEFFNNPIGTKICLVDDPVSDKQYATYHFVQLFKKRMSNDFPDAEYKISYPKAGIAIVERISETYTEIAKKRIEQWKKKLEEETD